MSPFWASEPTRRAPARRLMTAAAICAVLAALTLNASAAVVSRDSLHAVKRVLIDDRGVSLESHAGSAGASEGDDDGGVNIHVGLRPGTRVSIGPNGMLVDANGALRRHLGPSVSMDGDGSDLVRVFSDAEVDSGERVDGDVVAVFGSVTIHGQVNGGVVAVFGKVVLDSVAKVGGDAVAVGGAVEAAPGSVVSGQSVSLDFLPFSWGLPGLTFMLSAVLGLLLLSLFGGWLVQLLFADRLLRAAVTASRRTGLSFLLGLAAAPLAVIASVLLVITIVGIPIALLMPVAFGLLTWAGQMAGSYVLGCKLLRRPLTGPWAFWPLAAGTLFVGGFFVAGTLLSAANAYLRTAALFCDLLGVLLVMGLTVIGTGAFLASRLGGRPSEIRAHPDASAAPPAAAPAAPPAAPSPLAGV